MTNRKREPVVTLSEITTVILAALGVIAFLYWLLPTAEGQDARPQLAQQLRSTVYVGDQYRDFEIIWDRGDPADPKSIGLIRAGDTSDLENVWLKANDGTMFITKAVHLRERPQWESWHWKAFRAVAPVGKYQVIINDRVKGELLVKPAPAYFTTKLSPGERTNSLTARTNEIVRGYGCTMTGNLSVQDGATVVGLTIDGNVSIPYDAFGRPLGSFNNVVFDSCTFRRGTVGPMLENDRGCLFKDCRFENYTTATCSSGLFLRCQWVGSSSLGGHNFCNERSIRLAVISCQYRGTDRGLVLRSTWGMNSDNLFAGLQFNDINQTPNGGELVCVEGGGPGFKRNLLFGLRQSGCVGGILLFDAIASDNLINNCRLPIDICGLAEQKNNIVSDSEVPYIRINWRGVNGAQGTLLQDVASIGFKPSARGTMTANPAIYGTDVFKAVIDDGSPTPSTRAVRVTVADQAQGFLKFRGVSQ